jgi:hypothetical protein
MREDRGLDPVGELEFRQDPADVTLHGRLAEVQPLRDVAVGEPVPDGGQDLAFLLGQHLEPSYGVRAPRIRGAGEPAEQASRHLW